MNQRQLTAVRARIPVEKAASFKAPFSEFFDLISLIALLVALCMVRAGPR